ncbi:MAG: succinylglutamate desuccinylase/aspartoacylase family protein [Lewinellaceae bacterium]|nr:succinylglutamate desuccinylase/aspartoacylase family protein [Lewinellaceae bacterium]
MSTERIIGRYSGPEKGPLFICLGGIHGNEPAGVNAISRFFAFFQYELAARPDLPFRGTVLGLRGNLQALEKGIRFLERDLNRMMLLEVVAQLDRPDLKTEYRELSELLVHIRRELEQARPEQLVLLDFHTTSADGGIFSIPADNPESLALARHFHVPIIQGMADGLEGTSLSFFTPEYQGVPAMAVAFEAGQNEDPLSESRSIAAIIKGLEAAGCLPKDALSNPDEQLLVDYSEGLPVVSELLYVHHIQPGDGFRMRPGYRNFQPVREGEHLADDRRGGIFAQADGLILMPLYQDQGSNGFFLVGNGE